MPLYDPNDPFGVAQKLRMRNIFAPEEMIQVQEFAEPEPQPQNTAQNRYTQLASETLPERNNPGVWRRIAAAMAGFGGHDVNEVLYRPFLQKMDEREARLEPAYKAAQLENQRETQDRLYQRESNINSRYDRSQDLRDEQFTEKQRQNDIQNTQRTRGLDLREWIAKNPNKQFRIAEDGEFVALDPQNPTQVIRSGVKSGEVSDITRMELGLQHGLQRIEAQAQNASNLENQRQTNRESLEEQRERHRQEREQWERDNPKPSSSQTMSPSEVAKDVQNRVDEAIRRNPNNRSMIKQDPNTGTYYVEAPGDPIGPNSWSSRDLAKEKLAAEELSKWINDGIRPAGWEGGAETKKVPARTSAPGGNTPARTTSQAPRVIKPNEIPPGKILIEKNGKTFLVPQEQLPTAIQQGYRKVG